MYRIACCSLALLALIIAAEARAEATAHATLHGLDGKPVGTATLMQLPQGVLVHVEVTGLPPGPHGFHVHAAGKCEPPFTTAGPHFNPAGHKHGYANPDGWHAGDLPSLYVGKDGTGSADAFAHEATLDSGPNSLLGPSGSSLIIHAKADDYKTDPAGNSGDRIACGVVQGG